jgi:hypothetical protein
MDEETHKHRCLVRHVLRWRKKNELEAKAFIGRWMYKHPDSTLQKDCVVQWGLGNRGQQGDWRGTNE